VPSRVVVEVAEALCKGCGLCVAFCPGGALELSPEPDARGIYVARFLEDADCRGCLNCALVCPEAALTLRRD